MLTEEEEQALLSARERADLWETEAEFRPNSNLGHSARERASAAVRALLARGLGRMREQRGSSGSPDESHSVPAQDVEQVLARRYLGRTADHAEPRASTSSRQGPERL
jgi:hypothetical protein